RALVPWRGGLLGRHGVLASRARRRCDLPLRTRRRRAALPPPRHGRAGPPDPCLHARPCGGAADPVRAQRQCGQPVARSGTHAAALRATHRGPSAAPRRAPRPLPVAGGRRLFLGPALLPAHAAAAMTLSVVIPARDAEATLGDALDSLLAQTRGDWCAIVVDDGSTDGTADIVRAYAARDSRIRLLSDGRAA